ncbi:hypothetical protein A9Q84_15000 [Halobacteriovorax marinus]|uniref:Cyclic nucleotide-binding domain-containing protein n=1 Tax=Halobacteriovorax marinus TaxID=97084 RepID=A0A1Y5F567_9BACT|nr:hypothetical protein A9Q84_15000 [Halobacteriovorax marinus]
MEIDSFEDLRKLTQVFTDLSDEQWSSFSKFCHRRVIKKGEYFLKHGDPCQLVAFISAGLVRTYYSDKEGRESIKRFSIEGDFIGPLTSLLLNIPSLINIQAIEDTVLYEFSYSHLTNLYGTDIKWESLGRQITERISIERELREYELLTLSAAERLTKIESKAPKWLPRVSKGFLASYLGISPISLSRLYRGK